MTSWATAGEIARFVAGLAASCVLIGLGTLLVFASTPAAAPGWTSTVVGSGSMSPALLTGDIVVVEERRGGAGLAAPTVLLAERPGDLPLLHRVVAHEPGRGYRTKGDANAQEDSVLVPATAIIGVGRVVVPLVGFPAAWLQEGDLTALALSLLALLVLAYLSRYGWEQRYDPWRARAETRAPAQPVQHEAVQHEAVQDEAVQDEAVQDEAVRGEAARDQTVSLAATTA